MDILQLNALALESRLEQERDANPALEIASAEEETVGDGKADVDEGPPDGERDLVVDGDNADDFDRLDTLVREYDWIDDDLGYRGTKSRDRLAEESAGKLDAMANTASRPAGLHEHVAQQWGLVDVDARTHELGLCLINALDANGRLNTPLEELGTDLDPPASVEELETALEAVQRLEPAGIAARSLQESLLLQLDVLPGRNTLEQRILAEHFDNLQKNRLPVIAKALDVDVEEVKAAIEVIGHLSLHPGSEIVDQQLPPIVPDILVEYDPEADRYDVRLTRANSREMRISPEFRALLERARDDKATREFVRQKIEAANAIIDAVRYRRERLLQVAEAVVEAQREFLDHGEQHMKILRMSDLAERFGCDPSTISRTVDEKYIQTPRGIYPLRRFFTGGAETDGGDALGWASIKAKVQEIIDNEDKSKPLNDDEIVRRLKQSGVEIKRRTVAKYRAQLHIPPARQRRQY